MAIKKFAFFKVKHLSTKFIFLIFLVKVFFAWLYLFIHQNYYYGGDVFQFLNSGKILHNLAFEEFGSYFKLNFLPNKEKAPLELKYVTDKIGSYRDSSRYFMIRIAAILNWLSFQFNSVSVLLFQFFSFIGSVAIFKSFQFYYPKQKWKLIVGIFFIPSVLFWASGFHKEGISIFAIGLCLYAFIKNKFIVKDFGLTILALFSIILLFMVRNYLAIILITALLVFYLSQNAKGKSLFNYLKFYGLLFLFANIIALFSNQFNYLNKVYEKHYYFKNYNRGNSDILIPNFKPELISFIKNLPNALYNSFFRPHFFDIENTHLLFRAIASFENFIILSLIVFAVLFKNNKIKQNYNFINFNIFLTISFYILIGLVISNLGAIARYKSVVYPIFVTTLLLLINFDKVFKFFNKK